jgi:hypothetical protein
MIRTLGRLGSNRRAPNLLSLLFACSSNTGSTLCLLLLLSSSALAQLPESSPCNGTASSSPSKMDDDEELISIRISSFSSSFSVAAFVFVYSFCRLFGGDVIAGDEDSTGVSSAGRLSFASLSPSIVDWSFYSSEKKIEFPLVGSDRFSRIRNIQGAGMAVVILWICSPTGCG